MIFEPSASDIYILDLLTGKPPGMLISTVLFGSRLRMEPLGMILPGAV